MANPEEHTKPTTSQKQGKRSKKLQVGPPRASVSEEASIALETPTVPKTSEKSRWPFKRKKKKKEKFIPRLSPERTKEMLAQLAAEKQDNAENNLQGLEGKVDPKQDIDTDFQRTFAGNLFNVQGEQTTLSTQKKYDQEVAAWAGSAANRTRLIVIEATDTLSIKNIAQATFNAKPLERVLITGLTSEKEVALQKELKELWKTRARENRNRDYEKKLKALGEKSKEAYDIKQFGEDIIQPGIEKAKQIPGLSQFRKKIEEGQKQIEEAKQLEIEKALEAKIEKALEAKIKKALEEQQKASGIPFSDEELKEERKKIEEAIKARTTYWDVSDSDVSDINPFVTDQASVTAFMDEKDAEIDGMSLETLLGPHLSQKENRITHELLTKLHPQCDVNIEDVLCYGEDEQLTGDLVALGRKINNGIPTFSVKSKPFEEAEDPGLWHCASKNPDEFLAAITQGKTPTALLGKQTDGTYAHVILSNTYQGLLDLDVDGMKGLQDQLSKDKEGLKDILKREMNTLSNDKKAVKNALKRIMKVLSFDKYALQDILEEEMKKLSTNKGDVKKSLDAIKHSHRRTTTDTLESIIAPYNIDQEVIKDVGQKDVDYIGSILFDNCVYRHGVTPKTLETTRAKASSIQAAEKAGELKYALGGNIVDRPTSSAVEVDYAIGQMALDGGGDVTSEDLKKRNAYRLFYEAVLHTLTEKGMSQEEAILVAYTQTLQAHVSNEKKNKRIHELENGNTGAKAWRALGVKYTNKVKKSNNNGIKALFPSMPLFVSGTAGGWAWLGAGFATKIATKVNWVLGGVGMALTAATFVFKGTSMYHQIKANRTELNIANDAVAQANVKMLDAHNERKTKLAEQLAGIQEKLEKQDDHNAIKKHVINNTAEIIQNPTPEEPTKPKWQERLRFWRKKEPKHPMLTEENKKIMLETLKTIREEMPDIDPEVHADVITAEVQLKYTKELYGKQAEVSRQIAEKEYSENRVSWMQSGSNRARLLVLEANDQNLDQLATSVLEASPIERIMIAGLTKERQTEFETKLKKLWKEKLDTPEKKSNFEDKLNQPLMASTKEELKKLCASALNDNPDLASNFETKFKELWEKTPIPIYKLEEFVKTYSTNEEGRRAIYGLFEEAKAKQQSFETWLESSLLKELMGPHLYKAGLNLDPEKINIEFPQYNTNIEEVLCVGTSTALVENLDKLGRSIQSGVPVFPVKSEKLTAADEGLWKCSFKESTPFFEEIIKGKSASQLIGEKTADGGYANIEMSAAFQEMFQLKEMEKQMKDQEIPIADSLAQEDLDYVKKILFEEALCPGYITPDGTEKINAKSITQLGSIAGDLVGEALLYNLVGNPKSTVVEVMLAIASMTLDAGGDMYRHQAAKKKAYASLFEELKSSYSNATDPAMTPKEATKKALLDTVATITMIEKHTEKMTKQLQTTQEWRDLALDKTNETKAHNDAAIKALKGSGERFIAGAAISTALFATTGVGVIPAAAITAAAATGTALGGWQIGAITMSTLEMIAANATSLPQANRAANKIDGGETEAHKLRESCIAEVLGAVKGNNNSQKTTIAQALTTMQEKNRVQDEIDASEEQGQEQVATRAQNHDELNSGREEKEQEEEPAIWGTPYFKRKKMEEEKRELPNGTSYQDSTSSTGNTEEQSLANSENGVPPHFIPPFSPIDLQPNGALPPPSPSSTIGAKEEKTSSSDPELDVSSSGSSLVENSSNGSQNVATPTSQKESNASSSSAENEVSSRAASTGPRKLTIHKPMRTNGTSSIQSQNETQRNKSDASRVPRLGKRPSYKPKPPKLNPKEVPKRSRRASP